MNNITTVLDAVSLMDAASFFYVMNTTLFGKAHYGYQ